MSHIQTLTERQNNCESTGDCSQYYASLQQEDQSIDSYTKSDNQAAITWGLIAVIIGVIVLLTPFIKPLRRLQRFTLPKLAVLAPVIIGLLAGAFVGFAISFSACYKQSCSTPESTAIVTIPAATLLVTIPIARKINKRKQGMVESINNPRPVGWVVVGSAIILFSIVQTVSTIRDNNQYNTSEKQYLRTLER